MATKLSSGAVLPVNLTAGMIIAFKSERLDLAANEGRPHASYLDLYSIKKDIVLRISVRRGQNKVFFNDRAHKSLLDGWGEEKSVDLRVVDVERWQRSGVTISIHNCSTDSKERYQILFDLTTVCYFDKRLLGYARMVKSSDNRDALSLPLSARFLSPLSDPLKVFTYKLEDLPLVERQAISSGM
jgi:hypothetical protein